MTEAERAQWNELKDKAVEDLQAGRDDYPVRYRQALIETDKRVWEYVEGIVPAFAADSTLAYILPLAATTRPTMAGLSSIFFT